MSLYKRGQYWWINITKPNGERVRYPAKTTDKKAALELHDRLKAEFWRTDQLGDKPRFRWQTAVNRWLLETEDKASHIDDLKIFRKLDEFLYDKFLDEIDRDCIQHFIEKRKGDGVANATINRALTLLRAVLRRAMRHWEWLDKVPHFAMLPEPKRRVRWLTKDEAKRLLDELPPHLEAMARFTLATGLRDRNVTQLEWSQVDFERQCAWIHADQTKAQKPIPVPLNKEAMDVLHSQLGRHKVYVFTFRGKPVFRANNHAWRNALARAGIKDFRWHDLRHTWATWHVQKGTPLYVLQELGGWSSYEMVKRYAHFSVEHLAKYAHSLELGGDR